MGFFPRALATIFLPRSANFLPFSHTLFYNPRSLVKSRGAVQFNPVLPRMPIFAFRPFFPEGIRDKTLFVSVQNRVE